MNAHEYLKSIAEQAEALQEHHEFIDESDVRELRKIDAILTDMLRDYEGEE